MKNFTIKKNGVTLLYLPIVLLALWCSFEFVSNIFFVAFETSYTNPGICTFFLTVPFYFKIPDS